jgi:uncharacterized repeat protein (TIGR02543 family)
VVASILDALTATSIDVNGSSISSGDYTVNLTDGTVTFDGVYDEGSITLTITGTVAGIPVTFTTEAFGVNIKGSVPVISAISPKYVSNAGGTTVTLTGTNFDLATGLTVGGTAATGFTIVSATEITFSAPTKTDGAYNVVVTSAGGGSAETVKLTYVPANLLALFNAIDACGLTPALTNTSAVTVTGSKTGATATLALTIPAGITVNWTATLEGTAAIMVSISGGGTLDVATGGTIKTTGSAETIYVLANTTVKVSGGTVEATGDDAAAIYLNAADAKVEVTAGTVEATGSDAAAIDLNAAGTKAEVTGGEVKAVKNAIFCSSTNTVSVTGGTVSADGSAIYIGETSTVDISGTATVSSANNTIFINGNTTSAVNISGGTFTGQFRANSGAVHISGGTFASTIALRLYENSNALITGGTITASSITRDNAHTGAAYYIGSNAGLFTSSFTDGTNLFKLDGASLTAGGETYTGAATALDVVAMLSNKLDMTAATVTVNGTGVTTDKYAIAADKQSVTFNAVLSASDVAITVSGAKVAGMTVPNFTTAAFTVHIVPVITIIAQPAANTSVTAGSISGSLSVTASVTGGVTPSYQWYSNTTPSNTGGSSINNATNSSFTIPTDLGTGTYYYYCVVSATGGATDVPSNVATVTVNNLVHAQTPLITTHPTGGTVNEGSSKTLTVTVNTVTDGGSLSYQWYSNAANSNSGGTLIGGETGTSYTTPATTAATVYYYVVVTNTNNSVNGTKTATATSNVAVVTTAYGLSIGSFTGGSVSPDKSYATAGETVTLTITTNTGYESPNVSAYKTGDTGTPVNLTTTDETHRTFAMPAYGVTVVATWTATSYTITYNPDGGTGATDGTYTIESSEITLDVPTKDGYTFEGWYDNVGLTGTAVTTIPAGSTGNKEYWAKWTPTSNPPTTDQQAVDAAQSAIENAGYTVAQATANTQAAVKAWLVTQINALPGMSATGVTVSASDITVSGFTAATAGTSGNPSGTNGGFSFTVSLSKGSSSATAQASATIVANAYTPYTPPATYAVTIGTMTNGTVTASPSSAQAGTSITLTVAPAEGYELTAISAYKTGDTGTPVETRLIASLQYELTMPACDVTVTATFRKSPSPP